MTGGGAAGKPLIEHDLEFFGRSPLHAATMSGHTEIVRLLVQKGGADVREATRDGRTVLHLAASYSRQEILRCARRPPRRNKNPLGCDSGGRSRCRGVL